MPEIKHFVVLMLENHSFDHMLGCLKGEEIPAPPPDWAQSYPAIAGTKTIPLAFGPLPDRQPLDPPHLIEQVLQQICANDSAYVSADMAGFARTLVHKLPLASAAAREHKVREYMTCHEDGALPVLQELAREFGVCTHWFSSMPGSTTPNRMFAHAGTSQGNVKQGAFWNLLDGAMIFDVLGPDRDGWRVYYNDVAHLWLMGDVWTQRYAHQFCKFQTFATDVQNDALPSYSFIEPRHLIPPWSSQHPSALSSIAAGEHLIASVYETLASKPEVFAKTLFLIVYDEHGGYPDHVVPPGFRDPVSGSMGPDVIPIGPPATLGDQNRTRFFFDRLGPRVPAVVVSPWIKKGSVFGWQATDAARRLTFEHTSILATVKELVGRGVASARAARATPVQSVLNAAQARTDYPVSLRKPAISATPPVPAHEVPQGIAAELLQGWQEHPVGLNDPSADMLMAHFESLLV